MQVAAGHAEVHSLQAKTSDANVSATATDVAANATTAAATATDAAAACKPHCLNGSMHALS